MIYAHRQERWAEYIINKKTIPIAPWRDYATDLNFQMSEYQIESGQINNLISFADVHHDYIRVVVVPPVELILFM